MWDPSQVVDFIVSAGENRYSTLGVLASIKFLYLTPEKLCNALKEENVLNVLKNMLGKLYERKQLLRLVVDEAQCATTGGVDFRKDYGNLSLFRNCFPSVPVVALSGTACDQTRRDIMATLHLRNPFVSVRPCIRENLKISLTPKKSNEDAFKLMTVSLKDDFPNQCGIIYCIKKADCEKLSTFLVKEGYSATFYHDVRFVFHLSMPKSIESYYQECGRAGHDGQLAFCIMFYKFSDYFDQQSLIYYDPLGNKVAEIQTAELVNLKKVVTFCENRTVCRNVGISSFLDEIPRPCDVNSLAICDISESQDRYDEVDVIQHVRDVRDTIMTNFSTRFTTSFLVNIFLAKQLDKKRALYTGDVKDCAMYGKGADWNADNAYRFIQKMILDNVLEECLVCEPPRPAYAIIRIGSNWPLEKYSFLMVQAESTEQSNRPKNNFRAE
ncbi:Bloom syndrome protein homolog [Daphnia pulex]|uniref:Bloom syndrome protein homolog n=1 Tax=Daphnia pulex TaxID=6669 RepID=UPI001EDF4EE2|nr:Bloom syndrome protein homolog [Daphnia pulex]